MESFLQNYFGKLPGFSQEELSDMSAFFVKKTLSRDDYFLREGEIAKYIALVETGLLLYGKLSAVGEEIACDFALESDWVTQYHSFSSNSPSSLYIRALEPSILHVISRERLTALYQQFPAMERVARQLIEKFFIQMVQRTDDLQNLSASERYQKLLADNPAILQRVPQYFIANYLGITPQSLSRIRKK